MARRIVVFDRRKRPVDIRNTRRRIAHRRLPNGSDRIIVVSEGKFIGPGNRRARSADSGRAVIPGRTKIGRPFYSRRTRRGFANLFLFYARPQPATTGAARVSPVDVSFL